MAREARLAVALAVALAFAGAAPVAGDRTMGETASAAATNAPEVGPAVSSQGGLANDSSDEVAIETDGFDPAYDPATVLNRVERLRNLSVLQGITLHEYDEKESRSYDMQDSFGNIRPAGARALQLYSNGSTERRQPLGYTVEREAAVHIYLMNASDLEQYGVSQELVLAHEFVHALQFQHELLSPSREDLRSQFPRWTTDTLLVTTALVEGDAMWVTEQYFERYDDSDYSVVEYNRSLTRSAWPHSVAGLPYYYGYEFYEKAGSAPEARSAEIQRPPNSTAELLHPGESAERAQVPDPPEVFEDEGLERYHSDTVGELVVRHTFRLNNLSFERSADAAEGWVDDRMSYYSGGDPASPVTHWATVWESEREAQEFVNAWREMLDANGARSVGEGVVFVPASDQAPGVYYVVERDDEVVRITTTSEKELAKRLTSGD